MKTSIFFLIILVFFFSCEDSDKVSKTKIESKSKDDSKIQQPEKKSKEELFQNKHQNLKNISISNSVLNARGEYSYIGDMDSDARNITDDIWAIANNFQEAKKLKLNIFFEGANRYGETKLNDIGYLTIDNLDEVRRFKDPYYYERDIETTFKMVKFLAKSKNSPYYNPLITN
jgi:hypothetical protein